jgi:hypothetical protein
MTIEEALVAHLGSYGPLVALIGDRLYPSTLPQEVAWPAVTYQFISDLRGYTHTSGDDHLPTERVQIDCWSPDYLTTVQVSAAVKAALSGFTGTMGDVSVPFAWLDNTTELYEPDTQLHHRAIDVMLQFREAA